MANNALTFILDVTRSVVGRGNKQFPQAPVTLVDPRQFVTLEYVLLANSVGFEVPITGNNFVAGAVAALVFTPKLIGLHVNDISAPVITCGSVWVALNTSVTSLHLDNNLLDDPGEDVTIEVWLAEAAA